VETFQEFGLLGLVLGSIFMAIGWAGGYFLKRLLNREDGILTLMSVKHIDTMDHMVEACKANGDTQKETARFMQSLTEKMTEQGNVLTRLDEIHSASSSKFETVTLHKAGLRVCDMFDGVCDHIREYTKEDPKWQFHIELIRSDLQTALDEILSN